jgi:hypothetical protein
MKNQRIGSLFESFLEAEEIREEVEDIAQKRVSAWRIQQAIEASDDQDV